MRIKTTKSFQFPTFFDVYQDQALALLLECWVFCDFGRTVAFSFGRYME